MHACFVALVLAGLAAACSGDNVSPASDASVPDTATPPELRVLFIGNSYTSVNDLPGMLSHIATTSGIAPLITVESITAGGETLAAHAAGEVAPGRIAEGTWTHVVLQDQSVEPIRVYFNDFNRYPGDVAESEVAIGEMVTRAGAVPVWYATWAREASDIDGFYATFGTTPTEAQDLLTSAYAKLTDMVPGSGIACVGEAFRRALVKHPSIVLHGADGSHPTLAGTYLAASTFYVTLTGHAVPETSEVPAGLSSDDAAALRTIALVGSSCASFRARGRIRIVEPSLRLLAGSPLQRYALVINRGDSPAGVSDGHTLAAPFSWSSGAYPGYADTRLFPNAPPCGDQLAAWHGCTLALTYSGAAPGTGTLTLDVTESDNQHVTIDLVGQTTAAPLLKIDRDPSSTLPDPANASRPRPFDFLTSAVSNAFTLIAWPGETAVFHVLVTNPGGSAATGLFGAGINARVPFPVAQWSWGSTPSLENEFPGGVGSITVDGVIRPYCGDTLAPGATCVVTASFSPQGPPPFNDSHARTLRIFGDGIMSPTSFVRGYVNPVVWPPGASE